MNTIHACNALCYFSCNVRHPYVGMSCITYALWNVMQGKMHSVVKCIMRQAARCLRWTWISHPAPLLGCSLASFMHACFLDFDKGLVSLRHASCSIHGVGGYTLGSLCIVGRLHAREKPKNTRTTGHQVSPSASMPCSWRDLPFGLFAFLAFHYVPFQQTLVTFGTWSDQSRDVRQQYILLISALMRIVDR